MKRGIIFDMDGVLIDSELLHAQMVVDLFREYGREIPLEVCIRQTGKPYLQTINTFMEYWGSRTQEEEFKRIFQQSRLAQNIPNAEIMFENAPELMEYCKKRGMKLALASGSTPEIIEKMVADCKLGQYLDVILSGEGLERNKPAPDIYLIAAQKLGLQPEDCMVVEDSAIGIAAAKAAGMYTIAKHHPMIPLDQSQADVVIDNLIEIISYL